MTTNGGTAPQTTRTTSGPARRPRHGGGTRSGGRARWSTPWRRAIDRARELAGDKDVGIQGGLTLASAIDAGLVDELILHQVPVLLGGGRPLFPPMAEHVGLTLVETVMGAGVTHLRYEVAR